MEQEREPGAPGVQSVQRALQLLSLFMPPGENKARRRVRWSVSDLARASGLHKSVVARLMATMAVSGFVVQDPDSRHYQIGPMAFAVGSAYEPFSELDRAARPVLEALTAHCGHASYLGVAAGGYYLVIIGVEGTHRVQVRIEVGERRRYHTGAIGRVLLADLSDADIATLVGPEPFAQMTPWTIDNLTALLASINETRRTGVSINRQESIAGADAIAVGIRNASGETIAGLALAIPSNLVTPEEELDLVQHVVAAGRSVERRLANPAG